jgi:hypothetical protein
MDVEAKPEPEGGEPRVTVILDMPEQTLGNPEKFAVFLARVFYRELRRHQFTDNQIIRVASELVSLLTQSLDGYRRKLEKEAGGKA